MDKELKNYLRNKIRNHKKALQTFIKKTANLKDFHDRGIYDTTNDSICILKFANSVEKMSMKEMIALYEQTKKELVVIENLEAVLLNEVDTKILDWRFLLICLLSIKNNETVTKNLIGLIINIVRKDNKDYLLNDDIFHQQEKMMYATLTSDTMLIVTDAFINILSNMVVAYIKEYPNVYRSIYQDEFLMDLNNINIVLTNKLLRAISFSTNEHVIKEEKKDSCNEVVTDIKKVLEDEFKKYSNSFTSIDAVNSFISYLRTLTNDELLISTYEEKVLKKYQSFIEEQKEIVLKEVYKEDYHVIKDCKSLNIPEINSLIHDIYIMADMYLDSSKEDKLYLLEEFNKYMVNLKLLFSKYTKKEEKNISKVIYYTYKDQVVVYEQLLSLRKDTYLDYFNNINKIINNNLRSFELFGSNYNEPVYHLGRDNKVFYTFVNNIPIIICLGSFNDALRIVSSKEFKEFVDNVKNNINLYLENNDDHDKVIELLSNSKMVSRKLKGSK